ncbi:MAG: mucoidy inhibitor MuiA family protein [Sphingobacteriales bacterium]|nr:MAG: mucoidy inhibitor MuiA family protein [Sphingobacteriales bacterium]
MRLLFIGVLMLLLSTTSHAGDAVRATMKPKAVTLFLQGAKVTGTTSVALQKGRNKVLIQSLPGCIDDNSYRIGVSNGVNLVSFSPAFRKDDPVTHTAAFPKEEMDSINAALDQRIQDIRSTIAQNNTQLEFIKDVISNNKQLARGDGKEDGKSTFVNNLTGLIQVYETKSERYMQENQKWNAELAKLDKEKARWARIFYPQKPAATVDPKAALLTKELTIELVSTQARTVDIEIAYFVTQASWIPSYDLKVADVSKPMEIVYKGKVFQYTGQDWEDVNLVVSAFMPRLNQDRPVLSRLYVNEQVPQPAPVYQTQTRMRYDKKVLSPSSKFTAENAYNVAVNDAQTAGPETEDEAVYDIPVANVSQQQLNVVYNLDAAQTLLSDNSGSTLVLATQTADINARYYWVPRQSIDVYLVAWLKNWDTYHFLDGDANIFLNDNFVGKTRINTRISGDEFPVSLGVDDRVVAKRAEMQDKNKTAMRKDMKTELHRYELSVRNNTPAPLKIDIYDQFPVSESDKIKVGDYAYGVANYKPETGSLHWDISVGRGSQEKVSMAYSMSYPLSSDVNYYNR